MESYFTIKCLAVNFTAYRIALSLLLSGMNTTPAEHNSFSLHQAAKKQLKFAVYKHSFLRTHAF